MSKRFSARGPFTVMFIAALAVAMVLSAFVAGCGGESSDLPKDVMAKVGDQQITQVEFDERLTQIETQYEGQVPTKDDGDSYKEFQAGVLDYLVSLYVLRQKQAELEVTVTDEDINAEIDKVKAMFGDDDAAFQEALESERLTEEALRAQISEQLLIQKMNEAVTADVTVSDEDVKAYYDTHVEDFKVDETRSARHILFSPKSDPQDTSGATDADWQTAKTEAEKVRQLIRDGGDFGELAKEYSDDPGTKELGGDLGFISKGMMVPEFEASVWGLDARGVSDPVKTQFGYHIIQVLEIEEAKTLSLEEATEEIKAQLTATKKQETWEAWLTAAKEDLGVTIKEGFAPTTTTTAGAGATTTTEGTTAPTTPTTESQ